MKKIIITEEQLRYINESLGVPDNIFETAQKVYDGIINNLNSNKNELVDQNEFSFTIEDNFRISGFTFNNLMIKFEIKPDYMTKKFDILNAAYTNGEPNVEPENLEIIDIGYSMTNSHILINMKVQMWRTLYRKTILKYFKDNKNNIITKLAHELKHAYDKYEHPNIKIGKSADYFAKLKNYTNIPPLNEFIHAMYYTHDFETAVRCSEVYTLLKQNKIKRSNFKYFMDNNATVQYFKKLKVLDFDNVIEDIRKNYLKDVESFISFNSFGLDFSKYNDYQKIDWLLQYVYLLIYQNKNAYKENYLDGNIKLTPENQEYIKKHFQLNQLKTFLKYYYYSNQIQINKKASDMLNKLYNLYGLLTEGKIDLKKIFPLTKYNI